MENQQDWSASRDEPGAGGGMAGDPQPCEMERKAIEKVASHPGSAANAAGMHGQESRPKTSGEDVESSRNNGAPGENETPMPGRNIPGIDKM